MSFKPHAPRACNEWMLLAELLEAAWMALEEALENCPEKLMPGFRSSCAGLAERAMKASHNFDQTLSIPEYKYTLCPSVKGNVTQKQKFSQDKKLKA